MMEEFNGSVQELLTAITNKPSTAQVLVSLVWALGFTVLLWLAYRFANNKNTYNPRFAATLVTLAIVSTVLMDLIQSNLALSLGMLGSLSIVRFRTNIRDPRDIGFIFWSMAIGLAASTGSYVIGLTGSVVLGLFLVLSSKKAKAPSDMMLVVRGSVSDLDMLDSTIADNCIRSSVKAKNVLSDSFELVYLVNLAQEGGNDLINKLFELNGIDSVNLLAEKTAA